MHVHSTAELWALFALGQSLHILKRAGMARRGGRSRREFLQFYWDALLIRMGVAGGLFWVLLSNPQAIAKMFALVGLTLTAEIPLGHGAALIYGYFADSALDWLAEKVPFLRKEIPRVDGNGAPEAT